MKIEGWGTRWEWEKSNEVAVFTLDSKVEQIKPVVMKEVKEVLKEFSLPIDVTDGNLKSGEDMAQIQALFESSINFNQINYDEFQGKLLKAREGGRLPFGLIVLVDKDHYTFYHPSQQMEPAIYGVGVSDGLVILRHTHREAVRHEFGHMLGLGIHHQGCIMDYNCPPSKFCNKCKTQIRKMWQV